MFLAIAHPVRREILDLVAARDELPLAELRAHFSKLTFSALVQQLNVLRDAGLLTDRRQGRNVSVRLTPEPLLEVTDWLFSFEARVKPRLDRLSKYLEQTHGPAAQPTRRTGSHRSARRRGKSSSVKVSRR
ncbi:MAG: helix-turn-helix transcriptional regulator [Myxococcaceae bacterium]|nr:helix-turn-helix transcriptional regulator [Myxococcaceae bacterium]